MVDQGRYSPTIEGTPQGGGISPLLLNIALQGMEAAAGVCYDSRGYVKAGCPTVITYADLCRTRHKSAYLITTGEPGRAVPALAPVGMYRTPAAASIPCRATFIKTGLITPP